MHPNILPEKLFYAENTQGRQIIIFKKMSCANCNTNINSGVPKGCKNHGTCSSGGCTKLSVFDWLSNISNPNEKPFDCVEVRFKNGRKDFYRNVNELPLQMGDTVATEVLSGYDVGMVSLTGELVRIQMKQKNADANSPKIPKVYRKATQRDIQVWQEARGREEGVQKKAREMAIGLGLKMKISDVEFQGDGTKATFYYTAEERVDFRQLIKDMAQEFSIRIEMRQVGARLEAARLGGIGSCGRELCCSTWLTDFRSVSTSAARYQQLSLNPQKLAGQCGKLKCCLNFELDSYTDALKDFPRTDVKLHTEKGIAHCQKIDIFKRLMWFTYEGESLVWHKLTVEQVQTILEQNQNGTPVLSLEEYAQELVEPTLTFENSVGQESITRFDVSKNKNKRNRKKKKNPPQNKEAKAPQQRPQNTATPSAERPEKSANGKPSPQPKKAKNPNQPNKNRNQNRRRPHNKKPKENE